MLRSTGTQELIVLQAVIGRVTPSGPRILRIVHHSYDERVPQLVGNVLFKDVPFVAEDVVGSLRKLESAFFEFLAEYTNVRYSLLLYSSIVGLWT